MASSPRFPLPGIIRKDQQLFHDFVRFSRRSTSLFSDSNTISDSGDEGHMGTLLTATVNAASQLDDTAQVAVDTPGAGCSGPSDISWEPMEEKKQKRLPTVAANRKTHAINSTKRAAAPKTAVPRTRTRARNNMDLETNQSDDAGMDSEGEEGEEKNIGKDGEQVKRKRGANENEEEEDTKIAEKVDDEEDSGSDAGDFETPKAKLTASSPAKKKQKKPQADNLTPPPSPKKARGRASKASKGKSTDEDMDVSNDGENSSEEPEGEQNDNENEEKREETNDGKGRKGGKKKAAASKKPSTPRPKRVPKAKKVKDPADSDDAADRKNTGERGSTIVTKAEAGFIFDMSIADAKWAGICETLNKKYGTKRTPVNLKRHCIIVMRDRAMSGYPD